MHSAVDNKDQFFHFLGYGDIKHARVWFVGSEWGGSSDHFHPDQPKVTVDKELLMYDEDLPPAEKSRAWTCPRDIAHQASSEKMDYFLGNMAPLPRKGEAIPHSETSQREYVARVRAEYVPRLVRAIKRFKPSAVVFHGKGAFDRYRIAEAYGLSGDGTREDDSGIRVWDDSHVIACNSFTRGSAFPNRNKDIIASKIRAWLA